MDRQHIQDGEVIERYLQGKLTPTEQQAFEDTYLGNPELLDQLEQADAMRRALRALDASGNLGGKGTGKGGSGFLASPRYAAAASIALVASLLISSLLFVQNMNLREAGSFAVAFSSADIVPLVSARGGGNTNEIVLRDPNEPIVLLIDATYYENDELVQFDDYAATVARLGPDGSVALAELDGHFIRAYHSVGVVVPGRLLATGDYEVRLSGRMSGWSSNRGSQEIISEPFTVTAGQ